MSKKYIADNIEVSTSLTLGGNNVLTTASGYATELYVNGAISGLIDSAPATLDTLNELAAALGDDPNFATTVANSIGLKWTQDNVKISNWDTAYSWGNHASAGYLTSFTETDPIYTASSWYTTTNNSGNWNTAYGWGNHASAGYLTSFTESDTLASVTSRGATTSTAITISGIDSALKVQHDGTSAAWRGRLGSFNSSADKSSFLGNYAGRAGVFGHNNALSAWADLYINTLGVYGNGNLYLSWNTYVKGDGNDTNYNIWHSGNDGSGSGLDADLWDGNQFSSYLNQSVLTNSSPSFSAVTAGVLAATNPNDASGLSFRSSVEVISGEGWCTAHYAYNNNDGFLFLNRDVAGTARPVFHIGGYNNAGYAGWSDADSMITLVRSDSVKNTGSPYAGKGLSGSSYYSNIVKTTGSTIFRDSQGAHRFTGSLTAGASYNPTGSTIGNVQSYGSTNAYMGASDEAGRTAFFGVDASGYAMFGALTNHDTVLRANNIEYLRVHSGGYTTMVGSARAPLFYDSDNTGYYLDPASNSRINTIYFDTLRNPSGNWILGQDSSTTFSIGSSGVSDTMLINATYITQTSRVTLTDASYYKGSPTHGFRFNNNADTINALIVNNSGDSIAYSSHRAPIFYDSNNTGYYVDPNGSSSLFYISDYLSNPYITKRHSGSDFPNGTLVETDIPASSTNGNSFVLEATGKSYSSGPPFSFMAQGYLYANTIINYSGIHLSLPGFSQMKIFELNGYLHFWWPRWGYWNSFEVSVRNADGNSVNRVKSITDSAEPTGSKKVTVNMVQVAAYDNDWSAGRSLYAAAYYDSGNTAYYIDPASFSQLNTAKFGTIADSWGSAYIATDSGSSWSSGVYPYIGSSGGSAGSLIMLHNPHIPFRTDNARSGASGRAGMRCAINTTASSWWDIGLTGDEFDIYRSSSNEQLFRVTNGGNAIALSNMQAPIFYDSNNTSYYIDPAAGLSANLAGEVRLNSRDGGVGLTLADGSLLVRSSGDNYHKIWYYDGIAFGTNQAHGVFRFYGETNTQRNSGEAGANLRFSINSTNGVAIAYGDMRAPIFYDHDNTGFYVDPNSTSNLARLQILKNNVGTDIGSACIYLDNASVSNGTTYNMMSDVSTYFGSRHIGFLYNGVVVGHINATGTTSVAYNTTSSDLRLKKNISDWQENVLDSFALIEPKEFNFNFQEEGERKDKGFIAQEMVDKFPEAYPHDYSTDNGDSGYYSFNPSGMVVYLMKALKEQTEINKSFAETIEDLKTRIQTLENGIN